MKKMPLLLLLLPFSISAQKNYSAIIDSFMRTEVVVNNFNGNVLASKSGNIIYQNAFGFRNFYSKERLTNNSVFDLASLSKQFTAVGILMLKDQGKLSLSDSLRKFFPELPYHNITMKHLLTHTSGLPEYVDIMMQKWDKEKIAFNKDVIELLATEKVPVSFQPGERWEYCNTGYMLLASIIEKVSGKSFNDYLAENIFKPLGMNSSMTWNTRRSSHEIIPEYAFGFVYSDSLKSFIIPDSLKKYDVVRYLDGIQGDGTVNSTTGDLFKWDRALKNHTLLSDSSQAEMFENQYPIYGGYAHYGYGVMLGNDALGATIAHSGTWPGYKHYMIRYVDNDITIIALCNTEKGPGAVTNGIAMILNDKSFDFSYIHSEINADTAFIKKCTGKYFLPGSGPAEVFEENNKLFLRIYGSRVVECKPESPNKFFYIDPMTKSVSTFEFETDESGKITRRIHTLNFVKSEI